MTAPLPPLPDRADFKPDTIRDYLAHANEIAFQRALCAFWEARARALVDACEDERHAADGRSACFICKALFNIGDLPAAGEKSE